MSAKREHRFEYLLKEIFASWSISSFFFRYTFVILTITITVLLKWQVRAFYEGSPFLLLIFPVVLSVFVGGFMAGVVATFISAIVVNYLFVSPLLSVYLNQVRAVQTASFVLEGIVASALIQYVIGSRNRENALRQWYEVTLESIGDAVIATDNEGFVMYMNRVAEQLTGWRLSKAYGKNLGDVFNIVEEQTGKRAANPVENVLKADQTIGMKDKIVLVSKKGMEIPIDDSAAPIKDLEGRTIGVILVFHDVSAEREAQTALALSEERLRLTLRHTNIIAWGQDRHLRYIWAQNTDIYGIKPEDIIGETDRHIGLFGKENVARLEEEKRIVMRTRQTRTLELKFSGKREMYFEFIIQPAVDIRGKIRGVNGLAIDITRRKQVEERKDEFLSIASHELRTPLTSVKGYIQILEKTIGASGDRRAQQYIDRAKQYVERLNGLISDLLDVSRIQAGKLQMNMDRFDLDDLIRQSVENAQLMEEKHRIIKKNTVHVSFYGDRNRLEQVLNNLLSNAVKYSPDADKVIVEAKKDGNAVTISVQDFGIGIPAARMSRLFGRFYRVEESAHQFNGLGIGLYISSEIVKRHGGSIGVRSEMGKGSVFSVVLPCTSSVPTQTS